MNVPPPRERSWIAAVHASERDYTPLGTAVVLDQQRLVTAAHVTRVDGHARDVLWVAFPFAGSEGMLTRIVVREVRPAPAPVADLAVLELESPVPPGVLGARLRNPPPDRLEGLRWWAFGFPGGDWKGNDADGMIGRALGYGWVRLDTRSRFVVRPGFSGGGLWCPDYDAVIAVVGQADEEGNGQAVTVKYAHEFLPQEKIALLARWSIEASDNTAQRAWGWTLAQDAEADRHWRPRARGVMSTAETGSRFRGRETALREIVSWVDQPTPDRTILAVTGSPGAGKSAVLGRIVVTADRMATDPDSGGEAESGPQASIGSVACAVHVKGKTALDVAREIARAASAPIPQQLRDLPGSLAAVMAEQPGRRFTLVVDALDEASDPHQARVIVRDVLLPIAAGQARTGARILVGTRRFDGDGDLLGTFGEMPLLIDLDDPTYFAVDDLAAYAHATLQLRGAERTGNPYQADAVAAPVARRIAELAEKNFLIAGLVARTHGLNDERPVAVDRIRFTPTVQGSLEAFLRHLPPVDGVAAVDVLAGLAYIDAPGVPVELWQTAITAVIGHRPSQDGLREFARASAANFLVESSGRAAPVYRLFHQALNDTLTQQHAPASNTEAAVAWAFIEYGRRHGWDRAPAYLRRSLPDHARRAGVIDELLTDTDYTLYADLRRLIPAAATAATPAGRQSSAVLRRTTVAMDADPAARLALFSVTEALVQLDAGYRLHQRPAPYRAVWANTTAPPETGWGGRTRVMGVCAVRVDGHDLLASAGNEQTVRIWDPATGTEIHRLTGHTSAVKGVCAVPVDGRNLLATASWDQTVRIWDPATGTEIHQLIGHTFPVMSVCAVQVDGRNLLATASRDRTVRIWDPVVGTEIHQLTGHTGAVMSVCAVRVDGHDLLASAGNDRTMRIWDPHTATQTHQLTVDGLQMGVCAVRVDGHDLLASASSDRRVRIWDPHTGTEIRQLTGHAGAVNGVCALLVDGRNLLATASRDRTVRIWDPHTSTQIIRIPTYADTTTLVAIDAYLVIGLSTGLLTIQLPRTVDQLA